MSQAPGKLLLFITGIVYTVFGGLGVFSVMFFGGLQRDLRRILSPLEFFVRFLDRMTAFTERAHELLGVHGTQPDNTDIVFVMFVICGIVFVAGLFALVGRGKAERGFTMLYFGVIIIIANAVLTFWLDIVLVEFAPLPLLFAVVCWVLPFVYIVGAVMNWRAHAAHVAATSHYVQDTTISEEH